MQVQVRDVTKKFEGMHRETLYTDGMTLEASSGDFICITGQSGCGKTTLLRMIAGFEKPDVGRITIDGKPVNGPHSMAIMVFQQGALFPWLNVQQNIEFGLRTAGKDSKDCAAKTKEMLDMMNLVGIEKSYIHQLSIGMRQRVAIARALAMDPDILLMDEPFSALDYGTRLKLMEELYRVWHKTGKTILFVTHHLLEAVVLGNRILQLSSQDGRITHDIRNDLSYPRDPHSESVGDMVNKLLHSGQH